MKFNPPLFVGIIMMIFCGACSKNEAIEQDNQLEFPVDSAALLSFKWDYIKDSSTNTGEYYFVENGTAYSPSPGVYWGVPGDFVEFKTDGTVALYANNTGWHSTFSIHPGNKLVITDLLAHDTGKIVLLNETQAVLDWNRTSPNGGRYFRRMYLQH